MWKPVQFDSTLGRRCGADEPRPGRSWLPLQDTRQAQVLYPSSSAPWRQLAPAARTVIRRRSLVLADVDSNDPRGKRGVPHAGRLCEGVPYGSDGGQPGADRILVRGPVSLNRTQKSTGAHVSIALQSTEARATLDGLARCGWKWSNNGRAELIREAYEMARKVIDLNPSSGRLLIGNRDDDEGGGAIDPRQP